eukprot:574062-Pelagomonas_calceolata.AAC.2
MTNVNVTLGGKSFAILVPAPPLPSLVLPSILHSPSLLPSPLLTLFLTAVFLTAAANAVSTAVSASLAYTSLPC